MDKVHNPDFYEILEVSPTASQDTIERMYRYLVQRYHPDRDTGDPERFDQVVQAHRTLKDPKSRAAYDTCHKTNLDYQWSLVQEAGDSDNFETDSIIQERLLSVLYTKRKREPSEPGLGSAQLARLIGCPLEMIEFHLWYLRDKGWIMRMETGSMAITADGVDRSLELRAPTERQKLITEK
jgi:curved DNA-binding protein CbpA